MQQTQQVELKEWLLARTTYLAYFIMWTAFVPLYLTRLLFKNKKHQSTVVCIEAGIKGWELIEYKELYQSACEFLSPQNVLKVVIDRDKDYIRQIKSAVKTSHVTHYVYNPRTGPQNTWQALWTAFQAACFFYINDITPIVTLSDYSVRTWRCQAAILSAFSGTVVSYLSFKKCHSIFPHNRVIGPCLMPLSYKTAENLRNLRNSKNENSKPSAVFIGSLYEPRTSILKKINEELNKSGFELQIKGRPLGSERFKDEDYWNQLLNADIVVTTTEQIIAPGFDLNEVPSLVYRYLEALTCGALLVAPEVPGGARFFKPSIHFVSFSSAEDAAEKILHYIKNKNEMSIIAKAGQAQAEAYIKSHVYWMLIDASLGAKSLT